MSPRWTAVLLCLAPAADLTAKSMPPLETPLYPIEARLIEQTNAERMRRGLRPLKVSLRLTRSARRHTKWMCSARSLTHASGPYAENIAAGQQNVDHVIRSWLASAGHRANMLSPRYTRIGVAAYRLGDSGAIYWCQQFQP